MTRVYAWEKILKEADPDKSLDLLCKHVDQLLTAGKFEECDKFIQAANFENLNTNMIVGVLSVTLAAKYELPSRIDFYRTAHSEFSRYFSEDRVQGLLDGLK